MVATNERQPQGNQAQTDSLPESASGPLMGKVCVVMGIANRWSMAWAIAQAMAVAGGRLAVTYLDERTKRDTDAFVADHPGTIAYQCNVESDEELDAFAESVQRDFGHVDALVHSIAFAPAAELKGRFLETSRQGFLLAHSISGYSLIAAAQRVTPLMTDGGSIMTMTYLGSQRAYPNYNVMGVAKAALEATVRYLAADLGDQRIRVNAISSGPIKTASARGVRGFSDMLKYASERSPLKDPLDPAQIGAAAVFLASDGAAAITGDTLYVDSGYHIMGM